MNSHDRLSALHRVETDLLWLVQDNRWNRARQILNDPEMQAAVIAARDYTKPLASGSGGDVSDPTYRAAERGTATQLRASQVIGAWNHELEVIRQHLWFVCDAVSVVSGEDVPPARLGRGLAPMVATVVERVRWLTVIPQHRLDRAVAAMTDDEVTELDVSITEAAADAQALRNGTLWVVVAGKSHPVPSVHVVIEEARKALEARPVEPAPVQKALNDCRICTKYHAPHARPPKAIPGAGGRCEACDTFHRNHPDCERTEAIWKRHEVGKAATPAQIIEAKSKPKRKKASA